MHATQIRFIWELTWECTVLWIGGIRGRQFGRGRVLLLKNQEGRRPDGKEERPLDLHHRGEKQPRPSKQVTWSAMRRKHSMPRVIPLVFLMGASDRKHSRPSRGTRPTRVFRSPANSIKLL